MAVPPVLFAKQRKWRQRENVVASSRSRSRRHSTEKTEDRQTDRQTDKEKNSEAERNVRIKTERNRGKERKWERDRQRERKGKRETERQTEKKGPQKQKREKFQIHGSLDLIRASIRQSDTYVSREKHSLFWKECCAWYVLYVCLHMCVGVRRHESFFLKAATIARFVSQVCVCADSINDKG